MWECMRSVHDGADTLVQRLFLPEPDNFVVRRLGNWLPQVVVSKGDVM